MRFQPSWVVESMHPHSVDSIFFPLAPSAEKLLWFKRQGITLYANDPLDSRYVFLKAILENPGDGFSEANKRKFNQILKTELDLNLNPFHKWHPKPFSRSQMDYLFYWHEAALEIDDLLQRNIFYCAVKGVLGYWLDMFKTGFPVAFAPDEILGYVLFKLGAQVFRGREKVFALRLPLEELGEEVEASLCLIPLFFREKAPLEYGVDEYFHAWFHGHSDLEKARKDLDDSKIGWMVDWTIPIQFQAMISKVGKAQSVAFFWSGSDLPPRSHQEHIWEPMKRTFGTRFPQSDLYFKTADRFQDDYDFLAVFRQ